MAKKSFGQLEHEMTLTNLTNDCLDDLKKFYKVPHERNTAVSVGRRGDSLAGNILSCYPPAILQRAFKELPNVLRVEPENLIARQIGGVPGHG